MSAITIPSASIQVGWRSFMEKEIAAPSEQRAVEFVQNAHGGAREGNSALGVGGRNERSATEKCERHYDWQSFEQVGRENMHRGVGQLLKDDRNGFWRDRRDYFGVISHLANGAFVDTPLPRS